MRLDLHTHGKLAKKLPTSGTYLEWLFAAARRSGLDALCLTEHFNAPQFSELYNYLTVAGRRCGDAWMLENGLRIFPGMEISVAEGGHLLALGPLEAVLELAWRLEFNRKKDRFLPFEKLLDQLERYPVLVGCAHPFRAPGRVPRLPEEQLRRLQFLELNGKDMALDPARTKKRVCQLGERLGLPVAAGSDAHQAVQYGCISTDFERDFTTLNQLRTELEAGRYTVSLADSAALQVQTARLLKRSLKEVHALGGDYVSILTGKRVS